MTTADDLIATNEKKPKARSPTWLSRRSTNQMARVDDGFRHEEAQTRDQADTYTRYES